MTLFMGDLTEILGLSRGPERWPSSPRSGRSRHGVRTLARRGPLPPPSRLGLRDPRPTTSRGPGPLTAADVSGPGSRGRGHGPRDLRIPGLDLENFPPRHGCGESVRRGPLTPCTGLRDPRPTTDDLPRTGTSDRCRTLRTWESGPAGTGLGTSGSQAWT